LLQARQGTKQRRRKLEKRQKKLAALEGINEMASGALATGQTGNQEETKKERLELNA
jgi:hypothetical protein